MGNSVAAFYKRNRERAALWCEINCVRDVRLSIYLHMGMHYTDGSLRPLQDTACLHTLGEDCHNFAIDSVRLHRTSLYTRSSHSTRTSCHSLKFCNMECERELKVAMYYFLVSYLSIIYVQLFTRQLIRFCNMCKIQQEDV